MMCALALSACKQEIVSDDRSLRLELSCDTVSFDTVFTGQGSATQTVMIYNRNAHAIRLSEVNLSSDQFFHINLDGETTPAYMSGIEVRGHDSLYLYIKVSIDANDQSNPIGVEDSVTLCYNGNRATIHLEAIGQNVTRIPAIPYKVIRDSTGKVIRRIQDTIFYSNMTFTAEKPYLLYDTVEIYGRTTIQAGARLYFHSGGTLVCHGDVIAKGTEGAPIAMLGDRRDMLFKQVPYSVTSGQWEGLMIYGYEPHRYEFEHVHISGASKGIYLIKDGPQGDSVVIDHCRIHNMIEYGLALQDINSVVTNTEISNVARHNTHIAGGSHRWNYNTLANYFYSTSINIHKVSADSVLRWRRIYPVLYVDTVGAGTAQAELTMQNSIVTGLNRTIVAYAIDSLRPENFSHSWVHDDTAHVFRNTYYEYRVYDYYDFRLDSLSPCRYLGKDSTDAGCYPYIPY